MNGPAHYQAAEALLDLAETEPEASDLTSYYMAAAGVHATLALAAATALGTAQMPVDGEAGRQWRYLISAKPAPIEVPS